MGWAKRIDCTQCHEWIGQCSCDSVIIFDEWNDMEAIINAKPKLKKILEKHSAHWAASTPTEEIPF